MRWRILGPVEVGTADRVLPVRQPQRRGVLAYLLLNANRIVPTEQVIDALWGTAPPATARTQVHACVSQLRRALRADGLESKLNSANGGYRIVAGPELDVVEFADHVARGRTAMANGDPAIATDLLRAALALWRGTALTGAAGAFVAAAAAGLHERRLAAYEELAEAELALGRHRALVAELRALVDANPLRERLVGQLMLALAGSGQQAPAMDLYTVTRSRLADELGIEPSPDLSETHLRILRQQAAPSVAREEPAPIVTSMRAPTPAQLPPAVTDFVGRNDDLSQLDRLVAGAETADGASIISVTGAAGVGKTALVVTWAHRTAGDYPGGQFYVDLRGFGPGEAVSPFAALTGFLRALGVGASEIPGDLDGAAALYRTLMASRRGLVVLDNAGSARQVRPLLPGGHGCQVLVTSRDRLSGLVAHDGARRHTVGVLPPSDAADLLARVMGPDRVAAEPGAAAGLAAACSYLPLALRVAAANVADRPHGSISDFLQQVHEQRLDALEVAGDEEFTVRRAFDRSYAVLTPQVRRMLRLLSLVPGRDFTAEAAAVAAGVAQSESVDLLETLASGHLVDQWMPRRYRLHDLLRHYALERVTAEETAASRDAALVRLYFWSAAQRLPQRSRSRGILEPRTPHRGCAS